MHSIDSSYLLSLLLIACIFVVSESFSGPQTTCCSCRRTSHLFIARSGAGSKRQERVSHLVRTELAQILHTGNIKGGDYLEDDLRRRISVVNTDVSPDLRQARVSVSIIRRRGSSNNDNGSSTTTNTQDAVMEQRRAYSWLVSNTKALRHSLAQRMSHLKTCPNLSFVQVNLGAATDVMYLIDKLQKGYKRETVSDLQELEEEEDDWIGDVF